MDKPYLIDGEAVSVEGLIKEAKHCGYFDPDGLYLTSVAARILRENGRVVETAATDAARKGEGE